MDRFDFADKILIFFICFMLVLFTIEVVDLAAQQEQVRVKQQQSRNQWGQRPDDARWAYERWMEIANGNR